MEKAVIEIIDTRNRQVEESSGSIGSLPLEIPQQKKRFTVQFNPAELNITAGGRTGDAKTGVDEKHRQVECGVIDAAVRVTMKLVFDSQEEQKGQGVQPMVEGFQAALRNSGTRFAIFTWGDLSYTGRIVSVSGRYTMFDREGMPLRADISLEIQCEDQEGEAQWADCYLRAFAGSAGRKRWGSNTMAEAPTQNPYGLKRAILQVAKASRDKKSGLKSVAGESYYAEVQYNPSQISFNTSAGYISEDDEKTGQEDQLNTNVTMSFQLIFDQTEDSDKPPSVIDCTNGLISLMGHHGTRKAGFYWGDLSFQGEIENINAKYTMFKSDGTPLRSVVDVSIRQGKSELGTNEIKYWDKAFDKIFK